MVQGRAEPSPAPPEGIAAGNAALSVPAQAEPPIGTAKLCTNPFGEALAYEEDESVQGPAKEILHYREALWEGFKAIGEGGEE